MLNSLSTSNIIEIAGIIATLLTSLTAIIISTLSLKQNAKMLEATTRPYICIYSKVTHIKNLHYYLVLKNFGQTGAVITSFHCDFDLSTLSYSQNVKPFEHIEGTFIAPKQSFTYNLDTRKLFKNENLTFHFSLEYIANGKKYSETIAINPKAETDQIFPRNYTSSKELQTISYALQDIVEKML